jgi:hypothetical protein
MHQLRAKLALAGVFTGLGLLTLVLVVTTLPTLA